jgi:hypothetical protein
MNAEGSILKKVHPFEKGCMREDQESVRRAWRRRAFGS